MVVMQLWLLEKSSPATVLQTWLTSTSATEVAHQHQCYRGGPPDTVLQSTSATELQCYRGGHRSGSGDICSSSSLPPHHWSGEPLCCTV